ncbi:anthranilate synthase component I family protein [Mycolicibacterium chlorophenolicum]|uniref:Aminodeoxychorismate synthase component 1 n=1 Tax=Mycolicibacterium chlorophenolicum TaxID=37916 RepID=A0A0J6ZG42_9MYCO|nr:anthranilate synthase component I family protein [Mycolicibacterium chlorophenolicum]KMO83776.1 Aminodeoxychorismate synthase component 1 [Mycolicibacterium chlorophenolicum]
MTATARDGVDRGVSDTPLDWLAAQNLRRRQSWGRLDDFVSGTAQVFPHLDNPVYTHRSDEVVDVLQYVEDATERGQWAFGFISYEAAAGLDPALPAPALPDARIGPGPALPLVWFGFSPTPPQATDLITRGSVYRAGPWTHRWNQAAYGKAFARVQDTIAAGRTYQCNLTTSLTAPFAGDHVSFYTDLAQAQASRYCAYLHIDNHVIASASPELFFEWVGDTLRTKPMKGTAPRGRTAADDRALLRELVNSPKERAENIIIVDLLRNDLAKIAAVGTVRVTALLTPEAYPTVWQLTSEITAQPLPETGLVAVLRAMFPCGSVTGAPKAETMQIIQEVEGRQRGIYCGAIGWMAPPTQTVRARFSVAIRTAYIDLSRGVCEYGVGGGITWGSEVTAEFAELRAKRQILVNTQWAAQRQRAGQHHRDRVAAPDTIDVSTSQTAAEIVKSRVVKR